MNEWLRIPYNERLFTNGPRGWLHRLRYRWLVGRILQLGYQSVSVFELGCFDAKTVHFLNEAKIVVNRYLGADANWEGGLDIGRSRWEGRSEIELRLCQRAEDIPGDRRFDVAVALETLEHLPPEEMGAFLAKLARLSNRLLVTVPIERGAIFLLKHSGKKMFRMQGPERYSAKEWLNAIVSRLDRIQRCDHKGFDERVLTKQIAQHFKSVKVSYLPGIPLSHLNFSAAIEASND